MKTRGLLLTTSGAVAAGASALAYAAYYRDMKAALRRIELEKQILDSPHGPIEFAESGDGPAVFVIHGAGGGFDQGLELGRAFAGENYRLIAPSRFGYLGTALPPDASAQAQADAHVRVLDALQLERVPVIGISAGGPSAIQLCLRHPDRCSALILIVPLAWKPDRKATEPPSALFETVLKTVSGSDFLYWSATKVARTALLQTILGTPVENYRNASAFDRENVGRVLRSIVPISRRIAGIANDGVVASTLTRYALEDIHVPTLVVSAADDLYETYESAFYTAGEISGGRFMGFPNGGHLLLGHGEEVRTEVTSFLALNVDAKKRMAMAV